MILPGLLISIVELILLIRIWRDGAEILKVERKTYNLYNDWITEVKTERETRHINLAKAREAKAAKKRQNESPKDPIKI